MKNGGTDAEKTGSDQDPRVVWREGQHHEAAEHADHAPDKRIGRGAAIHEVANEGLQKRGGELIRERDQTDLTEIEVVAGFENRINGREQRLNDVIQEMGEADGDQDRIDSFARCFFDGRGLSRVCGQDLGHSPPF